MMLIAAFPVAYRKGAGVQPDIGIQLGEETEAGGEAACWAHLVCPECGAMESEGHRPGCARGPAAAG